MTSVSAAPRPIGRQVLAVTIRSGVAATAVIGLCGLTPSHSNHRNVWNFQGGTDGISPRGDLLPDPSGILYGTTSTGGTANNGVVYFITPSSDGIGPGNLTPIYSFTGGADGGTPTAGLIKDSAGSLYGTATMDGAANGGTVFRLDPPAQGQTAWTETTLWSFGGSGDGSTPMGDLVIDQAGNIYGTTSQGGAGFGSVFKLSPAGNGTYNETIVWNFTGGADGANPVAALVVDANGALYGTARAGGPAGVGTAFQLVPPQGGQGPWTKNTLWGFTGGADGSSPTGTLISDGAGGYYGTTQFGGGVNSNCDQARYPYYGVHDDENVYAEGAAYVPAGGNGCGVVFDLVPPQNGGTAWTETVLWAFQGGGDGANPVAGLVVAPGGNLYGLTTQYGEKSQYFWGTLDELSPPSNGGTTWSEQTMASFDGKAEGFYPLGTPVVGPFGLLYGTVAVGGRAWTHITNYGFGAVFSSHESKRK
jgi:uncharacterized repeat protein (TIGR03803 family)